MSKVKHIIAGTACALALVTAASAIGVGTSGFKDWSFSKWFGDGTHIEGENKEGIVTGNAYASDGSILSDGQVHELQAFTFFSPIADLGSSSVYVGPSVTVSVKQSMPFNKVVVDWKVTYPSGADASDVVTVTPSSDDSLTVTVTYIKAFSQQLTLTATVRGGTNSVSCTIDCVKAVSSFTSAFIGGNDFGDELNCGCFYNFGEGTLDPTLFIPSASFTAKSDFIDSVNDYLTFDITGRTYT